MGSFSGSFTQAAAFAALALVGQVIVITALLSAGVWLLLARAVSETEQRVFALAAMLLIGGVADYLSMSALFCGLVAGMVWQVAGGQARESLRRDVLIHSIRSSCWCSLLREHEPSSRSPRPAQQPPMSSSG